MNVYLNEIVGYGDAFTATLMSKRTWTREREEKYRNMVEEVTTRRGTVLTLEKLGNLHKESLDRFYKKLEQTCNWGKNHITLLRYIDFSFTVEGLHRGGQDDWDSHAQRFNNRIIRASTRVTFFEGEKSDFYKDKILSTDEALSIISMKVPGVIEKDGVKYVKTINGYIREDMKDDPDVRRGLYMLSIPSNFIFKVNLTELAHVYKERNIDGNANPEVKELAETVADLVQEACPTFTRELLLAIKN